MSLSSILTKISDVVLSDAGQKSLVVLVSQYSHTQHHKQSSIKPCQPYINTGDN